MTPPDVPAAAPRRVVGVAVLRSAAEGGQVLAARRTRPPELAGRWELPGGKCLPGETLASAARRELVEELALEVRVTGRLAGVQPVRPGLTLEVVTAEVVRGEPVPTEHDEVRWVGAADLRDLWWLDPDVPFLDELGTLLVGRPGHPS